MKDVVEPVGDPAADRSQREQGHELDQPDEPELERGFVDFHRLPGDVVNLPADDDDHRHLRDGGGEPGKPERAERGDAQRFWDDAHLRRLAVGGRCDNLLRSGLAVGFQPKTSSMTKKPTT